ncbi:hypothetical protein DMN91_011752 [Ooceraea biroi]|uniref:Microsomal glutathione S-transferase 1 n=1 Tax=Ooceraea biroi TaxID=2015173 RepID=A0A3L8D6V4_OOCBI|nr:microsomal glutathione S-transferase 1 [Ooceraea biroi]RLU15994.1 hypothetical protein DMN91_011752 [Ooceraea biroi]
MVAVNAELLKVFGFWGSVLVLKMLAMVPLTARQRFQKKIFANEDDTKIVGGKVVYNDADVERVRRSHLNDLENIVPWFIITYLWLTTGPSYWMAKTLIQTFVLARIVHTFSYAVCPQQPMRAISFFVGFGTMGYEALTTLLYYC